MHKSPPQFLHNPNFKTVSVIIFFIMLSFLAWFFIYAGAVEKNDKKANISIIEASLRDYYEEYNKYPETLDELVEKKFMNFLPVNKKGKKNYKYIPITTGQNIINYKLE